MSLCLWTYQMVYNLLNEVNVSLTIQKPKPSYPYARDTGGKVAKVIWRGDEYKKSEICNRLKSLTLRILCLSTEI